MATLILEDGTRFEGESFGAEKSSPGEVVFNTGMVGYPESLTDPSYQGQILCFTYPLIGNYGVSKMKDEYGFPVQFESEKIHVSGLIVHEFCKEPNHWGSEESLHSWLKKEGVPGIAGIDTRALTQKLREHGVMLGFIDATDNAEPKFLDPNKRDLVSEVSTLKKVEYDFGGKKTIALIDCGVKYGIIRSLLKRGVKVVRFPHTASVKEILSIEPAGIIVSNGPGDPKMCRKIIQTVKDLIDKKPLFGICIGNQILALAIGANTYKMKYGHRGQNKPCIDLSSGRCYVTSQNHGFAVDPETLPQDFKVSWLNADDKTVEGIICRNKPVSGVQFHPEASPGPYETGFLFDNFIKLL